jgi:clan AA aspartic protease (TIGR02281 family)
MDRHNQFYEPERGGGIMSWAVKQLVVWLVGAFVVYAVVVNYQSFRDAVPEPARQSVAGQVVNAPADPPARQKLQPLGREVPPVTNTLTLRARSDGHVLLDVLVNGAPISFIVDTGATFVSLTHADALKAGVAGALNYSIPMNTANGIGKAAQVTLQQIRIGELEVDNVEGIVIQGEGGISLLGQTFLSRLRSYQMQNGYLTLTWQE